MDCQRPLWLLTNGVAARALEGLQPAWSAQSVAVPVEITASRAPRQAALDGRVANVTNHRQRLRRNGAPPAARARRRRTESRTEQASSC